jgi:NADH dehydrogenase [ubiquinone] 1 alpha subcomplex assembly factor 7
MADLAGASQACARLDLMSAARKVRHAETAPLAARLRERIGREGPIGIADYMQACLADTEAGYYRTRAPIGRCGDFITAPEMSQIFGELLGLWAAAVWQAMGAPKPVLIAELGPGRGTLTADALRAWRSVPGLIDTAVIALVETSPVLRRNQAETLRDAGATLHWFDRVQDLPDGPLIVLANEFLDALPIRQLVWRNQAWQERCVGLDAGGNFVFVESHPLGPVADIEGTEGDILELRPGADELLATLAARAAKGDPVSALVIDYGHERAGFGDTLQAVQNHRFADPLAAPGEADLTAHVDFAALKRTAEVDGLDAFGPMPQGEFLLKLGLEARLGALLANATPQQAAALRSGATRLADPRQMGVLFKAFAVQSRGLVPPPPFGEI